MSTELPSHIYTFLIRVDAVEKWFFKKNYGVSASDVKVLQTHSTTNQTICCL